MSERPGVILALSPIAERQIEALLFDHDPPLEIRGSVVVADELPREAQEQAPEAVLLSPELSGLTPAHCERVRATGTRLVGLALDQHERDLLASLGVDETISYKVSREELLAAIGPRSRAPRDITTPQDTPAASHPARREHREGRGSVVAVLGVRGAPGASELAASLAALSARRWGTVLVEADALGGSLAARLGVDPGDGSITGLIRATQAGETGLSELVERWLIHPDDGWPLVLLGPSDPHTIGELAKPGVMTAALDSLASLYPVVVCDVAHALTDAQQQPVHLHREALINADAVVLVLGSRADQLHAGLRQLDLLLDVLNIPVERVRIAVGQTGAPPSADKEAITNTIAAHLADRGLAVDAWLPWDARGAKRAAQQGRPIALAHRRSAYTRTVNNLLDELFVGATTAPRAKRRKRRLPAPVQTVGAPGDEEVVWQR